MFGVSKKSGAEVVPVVDMKGVIMPGKGGPFGGKNVLNIDRLRGALAKAFNTSGAVAVALDINSPGGSPAQSELIGNHIRKLAGETNLPVYAFTQDVAASGGYWLACAADEIYSVRTSLLGSIGVVNEGYGYGKLFERLGLELRQFTAGKSKRRMDPTKPVSDEDRAWMKGRLENIHQIFKDWITERRGDKLVIPEGQDKTAYLDEHIFTGEVWNGDEAVKLGLADGIGDIESVLRQKFGKDIKIQWPQAERKNLLSLIAPFTGAGIGEGIADAPEALVQAAAEQVRDEIAWAPYTFR